MTDSKWTAWARQLLSLSHTGLHFCHNEYDEIRYKEIERIAADMIAAQSNLTADQILEYNAKDVGYVTPKVDVRGAAFRDGKILLASELIDDGRWTLPGGWADVNDTPREAVEREMREETGYEGKATKIIAVFDREARGHLPPLPFHVYKIFFLCEITGGEAKPSHEHEIGEVGFFDVNDLPELSSSRTTAEEILLCQKHWQTPDLPIEFD